MKKILDACCGSRMMWFNKHNTQTIFMDIRNESHILCDGRQLVISPDIVGDFKSIPFADNTFYLVVFDPPHLIRAGETSWLRKKYGVLPGDEWKNEIKQGFTECMRVLKHNGTLIFKWNEQHIRLTEILKVIEHEPLFGTRSGHKGMTIWMCFMKS